MKLGLREGMTTERRPRERLPKYQWIVTLTLAVSAINLVIDLVTLVLVVAVKLKKGIQPMNRIKERNCFRKSG